MQGYEFEDYEIERYQEEMRQLTEGFPQILRASSIAATQAALEYFLLQIAEAYAKGAGDVFVQEKNQRKPRLWVVHDYLKAKHGIEELNHWNTIGDYVHLRNAIAHGDGKLTDSLKNRPQTEVAAKRLSVHVNLIPIPKSKDVQIVLGVTAVENFNKTALDLCMALLKHKP